MNHKQKMERIAKAITERIEYMQQLDRESGKHKGFELYDYVLFALEEVEANDDILLEFKDDTK